MASMEAARQERELAREADLRRRVEAAEGSYLPTADQLLRGYPFMGGDMAADIRAFVAALALDRLDREALDSLHRLGATTRGLKLGDASADAAILDALGSCHFDETSDPNGTTRLRCVIYAAFLGDVEATQIVAAEAALMAYVQEWHREGDGTDLVWQAMAWSALSAVRMGPFRKPPYPVSEMASTRDRIDAFADEFRTQVFRLSREVD